MISRARQPRFDLSSRTGSTAQVTSHMATSLSHSLVVLLLRAVATEGDFWAEASPIGEQSSNLLRRLSSHFPLTLKGENHDLFTWYLLLG